MGVMRMTRRKGGRGGWMFCFNVSLVQRGLEGWHVCFVSALNGAKPGLASARLVLSYEPLTCMYLYPSPFDRAREEYRKIASNGDLLLY